MLKQLCYCYFKPNKENQHTVAKQTSFLLNKRYAIKKQNHRSCFYENIR